MSPMQQQTEQKFSSLVAQFRSQIFQTKWNFWISFVMLQKLIWLYFAVQIGEMVRSFQRKQLLNETWCHNILAHCRVPNI